MIADGHTHRHGHRHVHKQAHCTLAADQVFPCRELRELVEADEGKDCNTSKALSKALASLRNHPVRVADTESLLQLKFFGSFVCKVGALSGCRHGQAAR